MSRKSTIVQSLKSLLQAGLSASSWQILTTYVSTALVPGLVAQPVNSSMRITSGTGSNGAAATCRSSATVTCWYWWSEVNFYGRRSRQHIWIVGSTDQMRLKQLCQSSRAVIGMLNGTAFPDHPKESIDCNGGHAWAGWTRPNPIRGTYRIDGFHRFSGPQGSAPPFGPYTEQPPPPKPAEQYFQAQDGYHRRDTPVDLILEVVSGAIGNPEGGGLTLMGCSSPVVIRVVLTPTLPEGAKAPITWSGGTAGADRMQRIVPCIIGTVVTASLGANLSAAATVKAPWIKLERVGDTVISQDGQYSEDTTIQVTAVNSDGQTVTTFTGEVGIVGTRYGHLRPKWGYNATVSRGCEWRNCDIRSQVAGRSLQ